MCATNVDAVGDGGGRYLRRLGRPLKTPVAAWARDRAVGRRLAGDKPFEEPVTFDPVSV